MKKDHLHDVRCAAQRISFGRIQLDTAPNNGFMLCDKIIVQIHAPAGLVIRNNEAILHFQDICDELCIQTLFSCLLYTSPSPRDTR